MAKLKLSTFEVTQARLSLINKDASVALLKTWTKKQREQADNYAMRCHLIASDNDHLRPLKEPKHVAALPEFKYDGIWPARREK